MEPTSLFSSTTFMPVLDMLTSLKSEVVELLSIVWTEAVMFGVAALFYFVFSGGASKIQVPKCQRKKCVEKVEEPPKQITQHWQARPGTVRKALRRPEEINKVRSPGGRNKALSDSKQAQVTNEHAVQNESVNKEATHSSQSEAVKCAKVIIAMGKEGNLSAAVETFNKLKQGGETFPTTLVYNCLLDACVQCNDTELALMYFKEVKDAGLADIVSYNTLMKGHIHQGNLKAAEKLNREMLDTGMAPNRITYHGLLNARVQRGDRQGAWLLVEEMKQGGPSVTPNEVTCSILLKAIGNGSGSGDLARIMDLIDSIDKPTDEVLFASMVEACIRIGRLDLLSERTRRYARQGGMLRLSAPTYGSMIKAYGQAHDVERVWELWEEMTSRQVKPTAITLGCMVEALVMNSCVDDAWHLIQKLRKDESQKDYLNTVIYSTILKGFSINKQPDKVVELYDEMRELRIECNTITYNTILNAFARCSAMHRVPRLLEDMKTANPPVEPDIVTFSTIVKGYCMSGEVDKSFELLQEMRKDGKHAPDEVLFNSLLDGCAKQHRLEDALRLLDEMKKSDVPPSNYTLSIVVKLLSRARRLGQAFSMVESVSSQYGFQPNVQVYTCLIQACFHNRHVTKALNLYDNIMREHHWVPDDKFYSALVRGCLQAGNTDKAVQFVRCAHHLPGHCLAQSSGLPAGVERRCVDEVVSRLGESSTVAKELLADLQTQRRCKPPRYDGSS